MNISLYFKAHFYRQLAAAQKLAEKKPSAKNLQLLRKLTDIKNSQEKLIGQTVAPHIAKRTLKHVAYDGHGKIISFKGIMDKRSLASVTSNIIVPLADTAGNMAADIIRTPVESLLEIAAIIKTSNISARDKKTLLNTIKDKIPTQD